MFFLSLFSLNISFIYLIRIIINPKCDTSVLVLFKLYFFILH